MAARPQVYKRYKSDEAKLKTYNARLSAADAKFDEEKPGIDRYFQRYALEPREGEFTAKGQRVTVTNGLSNIDALFASLTAVDIEFLVRNLGHGTPEQAIVATAGINEVWGETRASEESADSIKDGLIGGLGFVSVGYEYAEETQEIPRSDEEISADVDEIIQVALETGTRRPTPDEIAEVVPTTKKVTEAVRDRIVVDYVDWEDVRYDTGAKRWKDVRWVGYYTKMPVHEVHDNPTFRKYVKRHKNGIRDLEDLKPDAVISKKSLGIVTRNKDRDHEDDRISIFTMFDFETGTTCTFPKGGKFLLNEAPNPFAIHDDNWDKSPLVPFTTRRDPRKVRGISEMQAIWSALDELELYRTKRAEYLARFVPKIAVEEGMITEAGKEALKSPEYGAVVETAQGHPPATTIHDLNPPSLPAEIFNVEERLEQGMKETTGVSEPLLGLFSQGRHSATEAEQVAQGSVGRHSEKRNRLERFFIDIARRILFLMQLEYDAARVSRITDEVGEVVWEWDADSITMEADLQIHISPKEQVTKATKRDNALALANVAGAAAQQGAPIDATELWRYIFEETGVPKDAIARFMKTPEEQQEETLAAAQQAEQQAMAEQGGPVDPSMTPGPLPAEELATAVNSGELPADQEAILGVAPGVGP